MKIKQLLRHTTILLRTALLLGAIAFVNIFSNAQTAAQRAEMPNAFETVDPTTVDWSQEPYFYIQFDEGNVHSFLGEFGLTNLMHAKDYVPFAKNIQWTLVPTGTAGQYYLKSRNGNYLRQWGTSVYCGASPDVDDDRYKFTLTSLSDGYYELLRDGYCLGRENGNEWGRIRVGFNPSSPRARLRFARLKSNIAHIIYYRGEHADGKDNIGDDSSQPWNPSATETRHYLTYSGVDYGTNSLIDNGTLDLNDDNSCFIFRQNNTNSNSVITSGIGREGTKGLSVVSTGTEANETDVQFFIKAKSVIPIGTKVRVDFDYKAGENVNGISTQAQALPSQYNHWDVIGSIDFTTNWQHFSKEFTVTEDMGNNEGQGRSNTFQTIAFNLGKKAATTYYFDNIVFTLEDADVSSRQSIIPSDKSLWTLPTAAAYHQDGLWALEPVGNNGEFYIKKYGTEEYLNLVQSSGTYYTDLGTKDAVFGKYKLEDPTANRYTAIQNTQYATTTLSSNSFSGPSSVTFNVNNGTTFNSSGQVVAGTNVFYDTYADLTGNTKMIINGTPGVPLRVLMNRQESNTGPMVEKYVTIGNDGKAVVDLTGLELNYSLPTQQATVRMTYVNKNEAETSYGEVSQALCGFNKISSNQTVGLAMESYGRNYIAYLEVDASAIQGTIKKVTLTGDFEQISTNGRKLNYGVGYNSSEWSSSMTWNTADKSIITLGATKEVASANGEQELSFDITAACLSGSFQNNKKVTILVYNTVFGGGYIKNPRVMVEYSPNISMPYVHLNAIKTGYGSFSGSISSITLVNENNINSSASRYLHYDNGDGYLVKQWTTKWNDCWYAGFYPVEVPVPNKDNYYQALVHIPVLNGNPILNYDGWATGNENVLWQLEQVGDYRYFRLKKPSTGEYLAGVGQMTAANDPNGESAENANKAEINDNKKFLTDFSLTWVFKDPTPKEITVNGYVRHKVSYLRDYAKSSVIPDQEGLKKQGLSRDVDSDWKEFENKVTEKPFLLDGFIQKTNYFEITHYLKKGDSKVIEFPTVLNHNNDHIFFQRFYHYDEDDTQMDLDNLKAHVSLDTRDDGDVQYFLYKNGMVTGQKLDWSTVADGGFARNEQRRFNFTNSDGKTFNVGVDVARYSDLEYLNNSDHLAGDLREPSLTMRYLFYMNDAKEMATKLTACPDGGNKWLESKEFHFGRTQVPYTRFKKVGYRGEFIPIRHIFSDYWVYDEPAFVKSDANGNAIIDTLYIKNKYGAMTNEQLSDFLDQHLVSAVNDNNSGKIEVEVVPGNTGIRRGGYNPVLASTLTNGLNNETYDDWKSTSTDDESNYQGFYFYDKLSPNPKTEYGNSRFVVFRYPKAEANDPDSVVQVKNYGPENPAYINVYLNNGGTRYQVAQFKLIFDANMSTRPWTQIKNGTHYANGTDSIKNTVRDPNQLRLKAGNPIAKVTFDYPKSMNISDGNATYHYPSGVTTRHHGGDHGTGDDTTIANSSPVPLTFGHTNYSFDGDWCNWGSYAMVTNMETHYGNKKIIVPADDDTYGYGIDADPGMQKAFLYIDASEQPGDICAMEFEGEFCANDQLMCTGWITGSNMIKGDTRCPGSITLTVKGEDAKGKSNTIYRFCPGQIYELDNGYQKPGVKELDAGVDGKTGGDHVVWQQFYFEFSTDQKYERYWLEVNNNCVSSNGGDFMLDNVEVYTIVPEVKPEINTPICVKRDANNNIVYDMRFLKLQVDYNKLSSSISKQGSSQSETQTPYLGIVFLEKEKFLRTLRTELGETDLSLEEMAERVENGYYDNTINGGDEAYQNAFKAALLRSSTTNENIWKSDDESPILGSGILYYKWDKTFESTLMPEYTFKDAVNKTSAVYRYTEEDVDYIILNGNFPELPWKTNTDYYIVPSNTVITTFGQVYEAFNICSSCSKANVFQIEPPYTVLGLESAETTSDYVVCEGQKPTMLLDLKGYDYNGDEIDMKDLNYDWWLGNAATKATLENYHLQHKTIDSEDVYLDKALSALRAYYPNITSLDGVAVSTKTPNLTTPMVKYLRELVNAGELVLHQKSISAPAEAAGEEDPYFYIVACPIHDEMFKQALNSTGTYSAVKNGDMERKDVSSFYVGTPTSGGAKPATLTDGVGKNGSRGLSITSVEKAEGDPTDWDTQFFIKAKERIPIGTTFHLEFDYKASAAATVSTQAHAAPGSYNDWHMLGDLSFTTEWQHFSGDIEVLNVMGNGTDNDKDDCFQTIAFNLWKTNSERTYYFDNVVFTYPKKQYVSFYCDEPQGYRVKVGEKAPTLKTGFVPSENGFSEYNYPTNSDPVLSIRLAKKEQFEKVQHGEVDDNPADTYSTTAEASKHFLWLPIRNAQTQTASGVIRKSADYNIYLSSTNDPTWDKNVYTAMRDGSLPIVGKIVQLKAINTTGGTNLNGQNAYNRLCVYFTENFEVREGYNYVLSLPFQEEPDGNGNAVNACDGTILINLKIVPDYEVWTGAAGNTDWNNDDNWRRADGNTSPRWNANDELYVAAAKAPSTPDAEDGSPLYGYKTNDWNYRTDNDRVFRKGFAPLYCTHVLMKSDEWGNAPQLYDAIDKAYNSTNQLQKSPFPNLRDEDGWDGTTGENATKATATSILRYDMQARLYDIWSETYGEGVVPNKGRTGDLIAEMYQINSCDEIAFQPGTELKNAHLLNYNSSWVEYQLDNKRWYLLGSPLQGTISGEWYAPTGTAKQETTYYDPVRFNDLKPNNDARYDRYSPAIYQRSWDKAKAVLYEVGSSYSTSDDSQTDDGSTLQGAWDGISWNTAGADRYLDRLGYKPMGGKKVNVAIEGIWSNTYNDAQVDYANGGFSVMVMNHLKNNDSSGGKSIIRLPKEDTMYDYYKFSENGSADGGTDTNLSDVRGKGRAKNRGRLKTDLLLPSTVTSSEKTVNIKKQEGTASRYGDQRDYTRIPIHEDALKAMNTALESSGSFTETVAAGATSTLKYYLVENPFACGLDMDAFFAANTANLQKKYWLLTETGQHLVQKAKDVVPSEWISPSGNDFATVHKVLPPGQGFFVEALENVTGDIAITFNKNMQVQSRYGVKSGTGRTFEIEVGRTQVTTEVQVDVDEDGTPETVTQIVYEDDGVTPKTTPIMQDVVIYDYVQTSDADKQYPLLSRQTRGETATDLLGLVITAQRGESQSSALVMQRSEASNDFLPEEDTETFINSDLKNVPTVYTLCGRLATTINSIHDFVCLPLGVESASDAPCTLTFQGVEALGDSVAFYDAVEQKLTPLQSGMQFTVSGQTQNRYYLVRSLIQKEAAEETHIQIFTKGLTAKVVASTQEPIVNVRCYDTGGRLIHKADPQMPEYSFSLPRAGIYIIEAETENDHKVKKVMTK